MRGSPVVMLASGTRGDVQPFLALAVGLHRAGIPVVVAAAPRFRALVESRDIGFAALEGNPSDLMTGASGSMAASVSGGALRGLISTSRFLRAAQPEFRRMLHSAAEACRPARAILAGLSSTWGLSIADSLGVPCILSMLQPFGRTGAFPSALLPARFSLGRGYNRLTYRVIEQAMWRPWRRTANGWRHEALSLPPLPLNGPWSALYAKGFPCLYGFSPSVVTAPPDWPASHVVTGYWFLEEAAGGAPRPALERFVSDGEPPLYIGFGSMGTGLGRDTFPVIDRALRESGLRAIISPGAEASPYLAAQDPRRTMVAEDVSHSWLFPRVMAVMHHGGAGTTAEGLRAGVPSIIFPRAVDQYFWAECVERLGVGPRPVRPRDFAPAALARIFHAVAADTEMRRRARLVGETVRAENGVARAVEALLPLIGT